jgi:hypothetical protein
MTLGEPTEFIALHFHGHARAKELSDHSFIESPERPPHMRHALFRSKARRLGLAG